MSQSTNMQVFITLENGNTNFRKDLQLTNTIVISGLEYNDLFHSADEFFGLILAKFIENQP
jgi:hypothetical protein